jgi:Tfp pilus assembly protein PilV
VNRPGQQQQRGSSYLEVLVAAVLIAIVLLPLLDAIQGAGASSDAHRNASEQHFHLTARLEEVLAEPFTALAAEAAAAGSGSNPASYSDAVGSDNRRLVYLSLYDGDNADADGLPFTGVDAGLMWVRVEIEGSLLSIETLVSE